MNFLIHIKYNKSMIINIIVKNLILPKFFWSNFYYWETIIQWLTYLIYKVACLCVRAFDDILGAFSMAEPATEITDHRLSATMTLTRARVRPSPETQCLSVWVMKPRSWEPNAATLCIFYGRTGQCTTSVCDRARCSGRPGPAWGLGEGEVYLSVCLWRVRVDGVWVAGWGTWAVIREHGRRRNG
jgi:hypothetical protein